MPSHERAGGGTCCDAPGAGRTAFNAFFYVHRFCERTRPTRACSSPAPRSKTICTSCGRCSTFCCPTSSATRLTVRSHEGSSLPRSACASCLGGGALALPGAGGAAGELLRDQRTSNQCLRANWPNGQVLRRQCAVMFEAVVAIERASSVRRACDADACASRRACPWLWAFAVLGKFGYMIIDG